MKLLVLDLATTLGFAFGTEAGVIEHGTFKLPSTGQDIGRFLFSFRNWLSRGISAYQPEEIVFESPILPGTTNIDTCRKLYSLCGMTELVAQDAHVQVGEANLTDIRNHFIGVPRAPSHVKCETGCKRKGCGNCRAERRRWLKETTITRARKAGFRPADDNDADALALFSFAMSARIPGFVLAGTEIARAA